MIISVLKIFFLNATFLLRFSVYKGTFFFFFFYIFHFIWNLHTLQMASWEQYSKNIYYDPSNSASFAWPDKLYRFVRKDGKFLLNKYKIRKWLQRQEPHSLQRPLEMSFKRNKVIIKGVDDQWDVDLMDLTKYANYNN